MLSDFKRSQMFAPRLNDTFYYSYLQTLYLDSSPEVRARMDQAGCGEDFLSMRLAEGYRISPRYVEAEFYRLDVNAQVMVLMRKSDDDNLAMLMEAFPAVWGELNSRYHTPGGVLLTDTVEEIQEVNRMMTTAEMAAEPE